MTARTAVTLAGILLVVAGLALYRGSRGGEEPPAAPGPAVPAPAATAPAPAPAALPQLLDFGRDT